MGGAIMNHLAKVIPEKNYWIIKRNNLYYRSDGIGCSWWIKIKKATVFRDKKEAEKVCEDLNLKLKG